MPFPTPHLDKLRSALENDKLPAFDKPRIEEALQRYEIWIRDLNDASTKRTPEEIITRMVALFQDYKFYIDFDLIFNSREDFLYRQKGQVKLDNSIIEEFLPHLIIPTIIPGLDTLQLQIGPTHTFSSVYFESTIGIPNVGGGMSIRSKDQDFALSKKLFLKASYTSDYLNSKEDSLNLAYVVAECKTNLDKTMFQEAVATAHDVKSAVPGAKYFLLCEWLDMTPTSSAPTDIEEVIILRKARRLVVC